MLALLLLALFPFDLVLDLGPCQRAFARGPDDVLHSTELRATDVTMTFLDAEFRIGWTDGTAFDSRECTSCEVSALPESIAGPGIAIRFARAGSPFSVHAIFGGDGKHSWTYKQIRVEADETLLEPPELAFYDVERLPPREVSGGGVGRPVFVGDQLFAGIEHPLCQALIQEEELLLRQEIRALPVRGSSGRWEYPWSHRTVLGLASRSSSIHQLFLRYLESLHPPARPLALLRKEELVSKASEGLGKHAALSLRRGWESSSDFRSTAQNLRFGLELSLQDAPSTELRARSLRLVELLRDASPEYLRLDAGDGDLISLLRTARKMTPEALIQLDFRTDPSPWWLIVADAFGAEPFGADSTKGFEEKSHPCTSPLLARIAAEHEQLRRHLTDASLLMPARAFAFASAEASVDPRDSCDALLLLVGSGTALPAIDDLLAGATTQDVRRISSVLEWAEDRWDVLSHTTFMGGSPVQRQAYGFHHADEHRQIMVVHNPDLRPRNFTLPRAQSRWLRTYPWIELLPDSGDRWSEIELQGFEVACFETVAGIRDLHEIPGSGRFRLSARTPDESEFEIFLSPRERLRFPWFDAQKNALLERSGAVGLSGVSEQRPAGSELAPWAEEPQWDENGRCHLRLQPLTVFRGERLVLRILLEGRGLPALSSSDVQFNVRVSSNIATGQGWALLEAQILAVARDGVCEITLPRLDESHVLVVLEQRTKLESAETALAHALRPASSPRMPPSPGANERRRSWQLVDADLPAIEAR